VVSVSDVETDMLGTFCARPQGVQMVRGTVAKQGRESSPHATRQLQREPLYAELNRTYNNSSELLTVSLFIRRAHSQEHFKCSACAADEAGVVGQRNCHQRQWLVQVSAGDLLGAVLPGWEGKQWLTSAGYPAVSEI
jgi:hypothetical protein